MPRSATVSVARSECVSSGVTTSSSVTVRFGIRVSLVRSPAVPDEITSVPGCARVAVTLTSPSSASFTTNLAVDWSDVVVRTRPSPVPVRVICGMVRDTSESWPSIVSTTSLRTRLSPVSCRAPSATV